VLVTASSVATLTAYGQPADLAYRNGFVYTVDARDSVYKALAVREGKIVYVGDHVDTMIGPNTRVIDLKGRMLMPGLVDGHVHALQGGAELLACNLNYDALTIEQFQQRIQACLDKDSDKEPDAWLMGVAWFREAMLSPDAVLTKAALDGLKTRRPIAVYASNGHTILANSRALEIAGITTKTPDPAGGKIARDATGAPAGIVDDAAMEMVLNLAKKKTPEEDVASVRAALDAMRKQGVTTFFAPEDVTEWTPWVTVQRAGGLTARAHFAPWISPEAGKDPVAAVASIRGLAQQFDQGPIRAEPGITVRNAKLFLDGIITAPAHTGAMLTPYFVNKGTQEKPQWESGSNRGPEVYFPAATLRTILVELANAGLEAHMHADGDRAVREALDAVQGLRQALPGRDIRAAVAHNEIVDPAEYPRFGKLNAIPVLSFQWEKPAADTIDGERDYLGPARFRILEPAGLLAKAGARIAFGSDWPVDPLNQWFALKVAVTRTAAPGADKKYAGRLGKDPGLTRRQAIRAITINSSYQLHQEAETGSLEVGKLADLIVLDRNFFKIPAEEIANIQVLQTVVGGKVVYQGKGF